MFYIKHEFDFMEDYEDKTISENIYTYDEITKIMRLDYFPVIISKTSIPRLHYGLFEWDDLTLPEIKERLDFYAINGHLYKTLNGYHLYSDSIYTTCNYIDLATDLQTCEGHRDLGESRGYWGLRCGEKEKRPPDIMYIGHTSGKNIQLSHLCVERDMVYDIYINFNGIRGMIPDYDS